MKFLAHYCFALLISLTFLAAIFVLPFISAGSIIFSIITGNWHIWHVLPMLHMILIALALHFIGPAFDRVQKISR